MVVQTGSSFKPSGVGRRRQAGKSFFSPGTHLSYLHIHSLVRIIPGNLVEHQPGTRLWIAGPDRGLPVPPLPAAAQPLSSSRQPQRDGVPCTALSQEGGELPSLLLIHVLEIRWHQWSYSPLNSPNRDTAQQPRHGVFLRPGCQGNLKHPDRSNPFCEPMLPPLPVCVCGCFRRVGRPSLFFSWVLGAGITGPLIVCRSGRACGGVRIVGMGVRRVAKRSLSVVNPPPFFPISGVTLAILSTHKARLGYLSRQYSRNFLTMGNLVDTEAPGSISPKIWKAPPPRFVFVCWTSVTRRSPTAP